MRYAVRDIAKRAQQQQSVTRPHDSTAFQHSAESQFVLLLLLDVGRCTSTFVLSSLRKTPPRIIVGESWVIWDQWHDGQGVVVASCLEKTPTATVKIPCRTCRKAGTGWHTAVTTAVYESVAIVADMHARTTYVLCYVPVVEC